MKRIQFALSSLRFLWGTVLVASLAQTLSAQLEFETKEIRHEAEVGDKSYTAAFAFTNEGQSTVTIEDVRSSCGCTVPTLDKKTYAPGESGTIEAVFTYGGRSGPQYKRITVTTDEGTYELMLNVTIPVRWELDKRVLLWNGDNASETQTIAIDFHYGLPVELELVEINRTRFELETRWNRNGSRLTLAITPIEIEPAGIHRIEVHLKDAKGEGIRVPFYIRIVK